MCFKKTSFVNEYLFNFGDNVVERLKKYFALVSSANLNNLMPNIIFASYISISKSSSLSYRVAK